MIKTVEPATRDQPTKGRQALAKLAQDFADGKVFTSWQVPRHDEHLLPTIFMPIVFGGNNTFPTNTAHLYEYYSEAGPRGVNGYPCFFSCGVLTDDDMRLFRPLMKRALLNKAYAEGLQNCERHATWLGRAFARLEFRMLWFWHRVFFKSPPKGESNDK